MPARKDTAHDGPPARHRIRRVDAHHPAAFLVRPRPARHAASPASGSPGPSRASDAGARQLEYQLAVSSGDGEWDVQPPISGEESTGIRDARGFSAREVRRYAVRLRTAAGWTEWSDALTIEAGVPGDELDARVIDIPSEVAGPVPLLRRVFTLEAAPRSARLRLSALGLVDAWINGVRVSDALLTPGWTSYQERILLDTIDVTGPAARRRERHRRRRRRRLVPRPVRLRRCAPPSTATASGCSRSSRSTGDDGSSEVVATDESWRGGFGAVRSAGIYDGAIIDQRLDAVGVHEPGFDDSGWAAASVVADRPRPVRAARVPARPRDRGAADDASSGADDRLLLDSGQNISGWVRLVVRGSRGRRRHRPPRRGARAVRRAAHRRAAQGEGDGRLHAGLRRRARARAGLHLPRLPLRGRRGRRRGGLRDGRRDLAATSSRAAPSARPTRRSTGSTRNVLWSQRDNFVSVPTDCPQRDERLGWTGDAQAFAATANTLLEHRGVLDVVAARPRDRPDRRGRRRLGGAGHHPPPRTC